MLQKFQGQAGFPVPVRLLSLELRGEGRRKVQLGCVVSQRIEGVNLKQWIGDKGPVGQGQAIHWLQELLQLLRVVHGQGVIHRDIKPSNIMVGPEGQLTLIDFATAREMTSDYYVALEQSGSGTMIFSYGYTPPEQFEMKAVRQSDFYALGQTIVFLLTGVEPGEREPGDWRRLVPAGSGVSDGFARLLNQMMAKAVGDRPGSVGEILWQLDNLALARVVRVAKSRWARATVAAGVVGAIGASGLGQDWPTAIGSRRGMKP
jgi:serine/threonine protein kinase